MLVINGAEGLGSGQLVRYALSFSALSKKPVYITNIRAGREQTGLKPQHLAAIECLKKICDATIEGATLKSSELKFHPEKLIGGNIHKDIGTAGSITLLIQNLIYPMMFAKEKTKIEIIGGTDVIMSPTIEYLDHVFLPFIRPYVKKAELEVIKRGFFPKGGGKVSLEIKPKYSVESFKDFSEFLKYIREKEERINFTERGKLVSIEGISIASKYLENADVARRQAHGAFRELKDYETKIEKEYVESLSPGSSITLFANFENSIIGADNLGEKKKKAEIVGEECARKLKFELESTGCIDQHLMDNLIPLLAIIGGEISTSAITEHTKTAIMISEKFLDVKFDIKDNKILCV